MRNMLKLHRCGLGAIFAGLLAVALAGALWGPAPAEGRKIYLNFAGSRPGGGWFYMAGGISPILTREIKDLNVVAESTQGDVENVRRMAKGDLDMAIVHSPTMMEAYLGRASFEGRKPAKHVRVLAKFYYNFFTVLTLRDSGITKYEDLKGKTVSGGPAGSGSIKNFKMALKLFGVLNTVKVKYLTYADQAPALIEGRLDAAAQNGITAWTVALDAQRPIRILGFTEEQAERFTKTYPGFTKVKINLGKYYKTAKETILTVGNPTFWVAHERVPERLAYEMVKVLFSPKVKKVLPKIHRLLAGVGPGVEESRLTGLPMHPGAARYWREKGLIQ